MSRTHTLFIPPSNAETKATPSTNNTPPPAKTSSSRAAVDLRALQQDPSVRARREQKRSENLNVGASVFQRDTSQHGAIVIADDVISYKGNVNASAEGERPGRFLSNITADEGDIIAPVTESTTLHNQPVSAPEAYTAVGELINSRAGGIINGRVTGSKPLSTAQHLYGGGNIDISAITSATSSQSRQEIPKKTGGNVSSTPFR